MRDRGRGRGERERLPSSGGGSASVIVYFQPPQVTIPQDRACVEEKLAPLVLTTERVTHAESSEQHEP